MHSRLGKVTFWSILIAIARWSWEAVSHYGNAQTIWGLVKDWPLVLQYCAWVITSWWFPVIISIVLLIAWAMISRKTQLVPQPAPIKRRTKTPSKKPASQKSVKAADVSGSNIAVAGGDVNQTIYHGAQKKTPSLDEPHPRIVALDDLKELLREGDAMLQDYQFGKWEKHTSEKVDEYISRVRNCARRGVLEVPGGDWIRFEEPWDMDDWISEANGLCQAGLLPDTVINPDACIIFGRLYGRVERLRELFAALTGVKIESPYVSQGPALYSPKRPIDDAGPRVVPPRENEAERDKRLGQTTLPRAGESLRERAANVIQTITDRTKAITETLEASKQALDSIAGYPVRFRNEATLKANFSDLATVEDELREQSITVYRETSWESFLHLWQSLGGLNQEIANYNQAKTAEGKNKILAFTVQQIAAELERAKLESAKPLS